MNQQHESRWSLNHTGNRVLFAVLVGMAAGACGSTAGIRGGGHVLVFVVVAVVTYLLATYLPRRR
ncbi:hypothetical protein [Micromonospora sp. DPT]|uniref:hypothetical protein n=1 Tax=Micromonospora sp. DPT TaxID=3142975 RepID=UPI00320A8944